MALDLFNGPPAPAALGGPVTGAEASSFDGLLSTGLGGLFGLAQAAIPAFIQSKAAQSQSKLNSAQVPSVSSYALPITGGVLLLGVGAIVLILLLKK